MKKNPIGIYYKQLLFFIVFAIICIVVYVLVYQHYTTASLADEVNLNKSKGSYQLDLEVLPNGNVQIGNHVYSNLITPLADFDQLKYIVFSGEGVYLNSLQINIRLPQPLDKSQYKPRVYAVHGVGSHQEYQKDGENLVFVADDLTPTAIYTIELQLPKGMVVFPWYKQLFFGLQELPFTFWVYISLVPLIIILLIIFYIYHKTAISWTVLHNKQIIANPPDDLSPSEASVLLNNKITPRAIAATFIDLAYRKKIAIVDHKNYFTFSKSANFSQNVRKFEAILLSKIFTSSQRKVGQEDIEFRIGHHIFSRKIANVYLEIYNSLFNKGYFIKNPVSWQGAFRRIGYIIFFVGLIGFILNIIFLSSLIYMLLIWFTTMIAAGFLIKISPRLPTRSQQGADKIGQWVKFKNFLSLEKSFGYTNNAQQIYEQYLAYAVAFGVEKQWTQRFIDYPFKMPSWLISQRETILLENLLDEIIPFVQFISSKLTQAKEPIG